MGFGKGRVQPEGCGISRESQNRPACREARLLPTERTERTRRISAAPAPSRRCRCRCRALL
ncbi:hypothetical protein Nmel_003503 [Mimus melanotis]